MAAVQVPPMAAQAAAAHHRAAQPEGLHTAAAVLPLAVRYPAIRHPAVQGHIQVQHQITIHWIRRRRQETGRLIQDCF